MSSALRREVGAPRWEMLVQPDTRSLPPTGAAYVADEGELAMSSAAAAAAERARRSERGGGGGEEETKEEAGFFAGLNTSAVR